MRAFVSWVPRLFAFAAVLGITTVVPMAHAAPNNIVITQVYGAGGLTGATYRQDFITLFNPTAATITANSWAIQTRSSTGTAAFTVYQLPAFTLKPGQYYLITGSATTLSSYGAVMPIAADYLLTSQFPGPASSTLNILSSTTETIALTSSTTPIPAGDSGAVCPALSASNVVDVIGYGATGCFKGGNAAPDFTTNDYLPSGYTPARGTSLSRINRCLDNGDNSLDFVVTPLSDASFQNSASPLTPCPATQLLSSASVSPGVVYPGSPILITASVTPATGPASAIASVVVNLQGIGGSLTQTMYDDGTHGDAVAGDKVYSISTTVSASTAAGAHIPNVTVTDSAGNISLAPASFLVTTTRQTAAIHTVQNGAPTNAANIGVVFTVSGIVTGVRPRGFYLQARDSAADTDPDTSEAIYVNTGSTAPPASVVVGNEIQVTGVLTVTPSQMAPSSSAAPYMGTELDAPTAYSVLSSGNPLPTPVTITPAMAADGSFYGQRYQYQSMLVSIPSVSVIAGTTGTLVESTETYTSDGHFYGVVAGTPRPFRQPGLSLADPIPEGGPSTVQNYDGNPEALAFDSVALGGTAIDVSTSAAVSNVVAIDDYSTGAEQLLISAATRPTVTGNAATYVPVPAVGAGQFTVGTQNMQRFYSSIAATGAVTLTAEAYQRRLAKSSLSIRKSLLAPGVVAVQEMGTIASLNDLASKINADAASANDAVKPAYVAYLLGGNDAAALSNGLLVDSHRITVNSVTQLYRTTTYTDGSGTSQLLFDDPPLMLDATIKATASTAAYPVLIVSVKLAPSAGETATTTAGQSLRIRREQQAEVLAALAQAYQSAGKRMIIAGDFGAPEFSDGTVDVIGVLKGAPAPSANVVQGVSAAYAAPSPNLADLTLTAPAGNRYSNTQYGSAIASDHILATSALSGYMAFAHDNEDFPAIDRNDVTRPERNAEHDGAVAYFMLPALTPTSTASITPSGTQDFGSLPLNTASPGQVFTFTNTGNTTLTGITVSVTGDFKQANNCSATLAAQASCSINVAFMATATGARTGTLTVASSSTVNPTLAVALTGTGTTAPVTTLSLSPASADFGTISLNGSSAAGLFLLTNTGQTAITGISAAVSGDYTETTSCGATLAPCSSCSIYVVFSPTASGSRPGTLTVNSNNAATPVLTSSLTGQGAPTLTTTATVSPTSKDFGTVNVGATSAATTFTFTNTGSASMKSIAVSVTGDFAQSNTCGFFLNPGTACTVSVTFVPTVSGARSGTLSVTSGSVYVPSISTIATLTGNGFIAANGASLSPTSKDYGTVVIGTSPATSSFVYTNIGNTTLTSVAVSIIGATFTQTNNCPATLAASATCAITVSYVPTAAGASTGTLTVKSSSSTNGTVTAALTGTGATATSTVTLSPGTQDFGSVTVGATSADFNFNFTNTGNTAITGVSFTATAPFQASTTSATGGTNCPTSIAAGATCTFILTFNPTAPGTATGMLTVTSSSTTNPSVLATLTGTGTVGIVNTATLTPAAQDFGSITTGSSSGSLPFTFTNTGNVTLNNIMIAATGPFSYSGGSASTGTTCASTLAMGASCTINLVFTPAVAGAATGTLTVMSDSAVNPSLTATLTGTGTVPVVNTASLTPAAQDFGFVTVGSSSAAFPFVFKNTGNVPLSNVTVSATGPFGYPGGSASAGTTCATSLAVGASCAINLVLAPTASGAATGTLSVTSSSSPIATLTSSLTGTGAVAVVSTATLTPTTQDFGSVTTGQTSATVQFTYRNTGNVNLSNVAVAVSGPFAYLTGTGAVGTTCTGTLSAGATCIINLVFSPTATGPSTGTLTLTSSSTANPTLTAALTGTGVAPAQPTFTLTSAQTAATIASGSPLTLSVTAASVNGYAGLINLNCTGAPARSSCTVSPSSLTLATSGSSAVTVNITTSSPVAYLRPFHPGSFIAFGFIGFGLLLLPAVQKRRLLGASLLTLLLITGLGTSGCGSGTTTGSASTAPKTYNVVPGTYTYTITASDGTTTKLLPFTVTVQ